MSERIWNKGKPPHIGWFNASSCGNPDMWRWWDGEKWSFGAYANEGSHSAGVSASKASENCAIEWTDYWPENARVPRIKP